MNDYSISIGYNNCIPNSNIYIKKYRDKLVVLTLYIDNTFLITNDPQDLLWRTKEEWKTKFRMTNIGELSYILEIQVIVYKVSN